MKCQAHEIKHVAIQWQALEVEWVTLINSETPNMAVIGRESFHPSQSALVNCKLKRSHKT